MTTYADARPTALARARAVLGRAPVSTSDTMSRVRRVGLLALAAFLADVAVTIVLFRWAPPTAESRLFAAFVAISGLAVLVIAGLSTLSAVWSAYLAEHLRRLDSDAHLLEATAESAALLTALRSLEARTQLMRVVVQQVRLSGDELQRSPDKLAARLAHDPVVSAEYARLLFAKAKSEPLTIVLEDIDRRPDHSGSLVGVE